ncbi:MAG: hypothetical protein EOM59_00585 [Clostridia bacterium]|nr:hypothetical protein [Clostridia bacterium]
MFDLKSHRRISMQFFGFFLSVLLFFFASDASVYGSSEALLLNDFAEISITDNDGTRYNQMQLIDGRYTTKLHFSDTTEINIQTSEKIFGLYIIWDQPPGYWSLQVEEGERSSMYLNGKKDFIHEYVSLEIPSTSATIVTSNKGSTLCEIQIFGEGGLPESVQLWDEPYEDADMLLLPTHADDEHLFFGGTMPYYAGELNYKVQVAYLTNHWAESYRPHELLNGLWTVGIKAYPVIGPFVDSYSDNLEHAKTLFDVEKVLSYEVELLRRFKPEVVIGHDIDGEYGHGVHMLNTWVLQQAIHLASDETYLPEQVSKYGAFDVSKVYLHLYPENPVVMNWNIPLANFSGKTAFEMAELGFSKHVSQQEWFSVRNQGVHDCRAFGLYYTSVGYDSSESVPDFFENINAFSDDVLIVPEEETDLKQEEQEEEVSKVGFFDAEFFNNPQIKGPVLLTGFLFVVFILLVIWGRIRNRK